jgi:putative transposase
MEPSLPDLAPEQRYPSDLLDAHWARLQALLPARTGRGRPQRYDLRQVITAILYLLRSGCQWRMLPRDFPKWQAVRYHFDEAKRTGSGSASIRPCANRPARWPAGADPDGRHPRQSSVKTSEAGGERGTTGKKR